MEQPNLSRAKEAVPPPVITQISHPLATIWIARERWNGASYFYGGTRLIDPSISDLMAKDMLVRLMETESGTKNRLIDHAIAEGALDGMGANLPPGFLQSRVGGARCLIRPLTREIASTLADPSHLENAQVTAAVLERLGDALNEEEPRVRLTPDFGRYAGLADVLHQYTPNVLGIRCNKGGCGGKSSYSATGVLAGVAQAASALLEDRPVTCIGSAGAMGTQVLQHFLACGIKDLAACDLAYEMPNGPSVPQGCTHLKSRPGCFTAESLDRGGVIAATTVGDELARSTWSAIPAQTVLCLAHNLALPAGPEGIRLSRELAGRGVLVIPGQVLTLGGALTARLEWYWRQLPTKPDFNKALAHTVVTRTVSHLVREMLAIAEAAGTAPYEAMLSMAGEGVQ